MSLDHWKTASRNNSGGGVVCGNVKEAICVDWCTVVPHAVHLGVLFIMPVPDLFGVIDLKAPA